MIESFDDLAELLVQLLTPIITNLANYSCIAIHCNQPESMVHRLELRFTYIFTNAQILYIIIYNS